MKSIVPNKDENKLLSLQILRGLAVLLVVYAHAIDNQIELHIGESFQQKFYFLENFGAVGVDIFFVISGFIISLVSKKYLRPYGFKDFLIKRFIRIVPAYWIITTIVLILSILTLNSSGFNLRYILKSFLVLPIFDSGWFIFPALLVGWTLAFEMYFYIVVSVFTLSKSRHFLFYSFTFITLLVLAGLAFKDSTNVIFKFVSNPINLEFVLGCMIGVVYSSRIRISYLLSMFLAVVGLLCLGITIFTGYGDISEAEKIVNGNLGFLRVFLWGVPSAILVAGFVFLEARVSASILKYLILIGDASYSIYLTHYLSMSIYKSNWRFFNLLYPDFFVVTAIAFSTAVGIAFYFMVERNLVNSLNHLYTEFCEKRDLYSTRSK
jgi:exopolysaccharide production protein ExoZ